MKKLGFPLLLAALVGLFAFTEVLPIGASMPKAELKMTDISGKQVSLKDAVGTNGLLVMFSCNTCPFVVKYQERTIESSNYALGKKIGVIVVNSNEAQRGADDSFDAMKEYAKTQGYKWNYVVDKNSELADAFGANRTPECFLFDKSGKLVYHGAIDDNANDAAAATRKHLKEAMDELTSGKEVSVKETRSVGCTIKRVK
ncbi:redoxin family protein [Flaviaesturariibacter amylovorans]|uniref:Thioredoxin family protein n=1 Tax=Flaviaesturariibacter amylovorans TaxID=1084520 RepID=A0ABP8GSN0_9BACT